MNILENLYHYTTIEKLALILRSGKIRFSALSNLDDLTESYTQDLGNISSFILVSCWTNIEEENIALWNMYCKNGRGIRIKMRTSIFHRENTDKLDYFVEVDKNANLWYPSNSLTKVKYLVNPKRSFRSKEGEVDLSKLAKEKDKVWEFQNEWRFILYQFPNKELLSEVFNNNLNPIETKKIFENYNFTHNYYDYVIANSELKFMEITLGPSTTLAEEIIVEALVSKYNSHAKIKKSNLIDHIRLK